MMLLWDTHLFVTEENVKGIIDREFQQTWGLKYDGNYKVDKEEVADAKFVSISEIEEILKNKPESLTPWFRNELQHLSKDKWASLEKLLL